MNIEFGLKELTDITLKATYPIEIGARTFEAGEVIARFDKIQISNFNELIERVQATGGFNNRSLIVWDHTKQLEFSFSQGVFSKEQFALLNNAKLITNKERSIYISKHESCESDRDKEITLAKKNIRNVFVYDRNSGEKIKILAQDYTQGKIAIAQAFQDVEVDYEFAYTNSHSDMLIGQRLIKGYLQFEGKTKVKDDSDGIVRTAILRIPRMKLMSDLSMRLGREATPIVANFEAIGVPTGERGNEMVMELIFLEDDIDADM